MLIFKIITYLFAIIIVGIFSYIVFYAIFWRSYKQKKEIEKLIQQINSLPLDSENYSATEIFIAVKLLNRVGKLAYSKVDEYPTLYKFWYQKIDIVFQFEKLIEKFNLNIKSQDFEKEEGNIRCLR